MSTIYLCSIPEFSQDYKHVGRFNNLNQQLAFMNSKVKRQIVSNTKVDRFMDMITLNTTMDSTVRSCDYLFSTTTDGEYVFYFINQIEILTTSTVRLMVTLDVWQTYHLRMTLLPSFVERCHVPRWKSTNIPTKEIVSEPLGNYESTVIKEENVPNNKGVYIITSTTPLGKVSNRPSGGSGGGGGGGDIPTGGCGNPSEGIPTSNGFLFIKGYEGLAQYAHNIGDGVMTIGYGCTDKYDGDNYVTLKANEPVSDELASTIMAQSLVSNYGVPLKNSLANDGIIVSANEFDAILSFVYNAGLGSWNNSAIRTALLNGDKNGAYTAWLTQNIMSGTQFEAGLRARRQAEANIFKSSQYELRTITIYGQGGSVVGSINASESHVPSLISDECSQPTGLVEIEDENGVKGMFPCASGRFTNVYPNYNDGTYHGAVDLSGNDAVNIYPPRDNMKVVKVVGGYPNERNDSIGYGNYCVLEDNETKQRYWLGHMRTTPLVQEGDTVNQNTVIGNVGTSGYSTGPHLHYEIRVSPYGSDNRINPIKYIYSSDGTKHEPSINETFTRGEK